MKSFMIFPVLAFGIAVTCSAQDPFCPYKEFPYKFCDRHGHLTTKCSSDPHREPGLTPMRIAEPPCMIPARTYQKVIEMSASPGPQIIKVFDPFEGLQDLNYAWEQWVRLCPNMQGAPGNGWCCTKVSMSESTLDFSDPVNDLDRDLLLWVSNFKTCRVDCDQSYDIYINFTDKLLWEDKDPDTNPVGFSWFSGPQSPKDNVEGIHGEVLSFRRYMMYTFGISLGLLDRSGDAEDTGCDDWTTVMGNGQTDEDPGELTGDDKCQFIKLYCPDQVGLEPVLSVEKGSATGLSLSQNIPNPFTEMTTIPYTLAGAGVVNLRIIDSKGRDIKTLVDQRMEAGSYTVGFRASDDMPAGPYWYVLRVGDVIRAKEMILVR